jgi:hypothetical protein
MTPIRARQVHLDFHNSEHLPDVGAAFDARRFQEALRLGRVNHVNVFAKCAQGWSYYPTTVGTVHPTLRRNLLGEQIEACHQVDVRAPIYFCIGFSDNDQRVHPSWSARGRDGSVLNAFWDEKAGPDQRKPIFSWPFLCPSGDYRELVLAQTREICGMVPVDGFWFDVCACSGPCFCDYCRRGMQAAGLNASDDAQSARYYDGVWESLLSACSGTVRERFPDASVFFNGTTSWGHDFSRWQTQLEMEDLPTSSGGYDRLPLRCKHYSSTGLPLVGMTGKFHTSWGEFGGFKHPSALRYECAAMISWSAACSVGDQLHPTGEVDLETYRLIGEAFRYVEQIEEYGLGGRMCSNLGLWISGALAHDQGVANMLLESQHDFEAAGPGSDLSRFQTVILPGGRCLDAAAAEKVRSYLDAGGTVLALSESALGAAEDRFVLPVGAAYVGPGAFECDYLVVGTEIGAGLVTSPILHNHPALRVRPEGAQVLARIREPYFNRTYGHYVSHQNAPYTPDVAAHPGALRNGRIVYLPHPLGRIYLEHGARAHRDLFLNALHLLYTRPTLAVRLPSAGRVNLLHQPDKGRYVVHLLYAPPLLRGTCLVIDDMPPLLDVSVRLRVQRAITRASLAPQGTELAISREEDAISVVVPRVEAHQAVVFEYREA